MHLTDEYPIKYEAERLPPPVVADLNGDGKKEVLVATHDAKIQVLSFPNFPQFFYSLIKFHALFGFLHNWTSMQAIIQLGIVKKTFFFFFFQ